MVKLDNDWDSLLENEFKKDYYITLREFLKGEYRHKVIYPDMHDIFNALRYTSYSAVKAVVVGQDPYIRPGEAHGLSFSVKPPTRIPPSLQNIFKEIQSDIGCALPNNGYLVHWAKQGVMMLNSVLTVEQGKSRSHAGKGWETFTSSVLELINKKDAPVVFLLWGKDAQIKGQFLNNPRHLVLTAAHPSPLAGGRFFGCRHFSKTNEYLIKNGVEPIDWQIQNILQE